jgi:hypothetical protein
MAQAMTGTLSTITAYVLVYNCAAFTGRALDSVPARDGPRELLRLADQQRAAG